MYPALDAIRVLHVDDQPEFAATAAAFLEGTDDRFEIETAASATEGLSRLSERAFDCVVSDYDMPGRNGLEFLDSVREEYPDLPFVLFTGKGSEEVASEAISAGVSDYLQKKTGTSQYTLLANRVRNAVEQYRGRVALEESEKRLSLFFEQSPLGVVEYNEDFEIVRVNPAGEEIFGYTEEELRGETWEVFVTERSYENVDAITDALSEATGGFHSIDENVRKDGTHIVCEWHNRVVTDENGEAVAVFSQFQDITERTERERELKRYESMVNTMQEAACIYDAEGRFVVVNESLADFYGTTPEALEGQESGLVPHVSAGGDGDRYQELLDSEREEISGEIEAELRGRGPEVLQYTLTPLRIDGRITGVIGVTHEITAFRDRERELERKNEQLESFASVVSHDLRNPLSVADGRLELAMEECDSEHLPPAARAVWRSQALVEDLLTLARDGDRVSDTTVVDLAALVAECWDATTTSDATLRVEAERSLRADPSRLQQLLENLLANVVDHGSPAVTVTVGDLPDGFYVSDDGPGVAPAERQRVFEAGYSTSRDGTGFGLAIVREIAEAHGWTVTVTDGDAGGARFEVRGVEEMG